MTACRSCGASIVWCWSTKGVPTPVDPEPVPDGNVTVEGGGRIASGVRIVVGSIQPGLFDAPELRYQTHFVTCPDAARWRNTPSPGGG